MWKNFLDGVASDGGNIFILMILTLTIGVFMKCGIPELHDQFIFTLGALVGILKGNLTKSN